MSEPSARWVLTARGRVQRVGYRDTVEEVARVLGVAGTVENDSKDDKLVHIIVQGPASTLNEFVKAISGKHDYAEAEVQKAAEGACDPALTDFTKIRGPEAKETLERADQSVLILGTVAKAMHRLADTGEATLLVSRESLAVGKETLAVGKEALAETRKVGQAVERVGQAVDKVGQSVDRVGQSVEKGNQATALLHRDMTHRFDEMGHAYGIIGKTLVKIDKDLRAQTKALLQLARAVERNTRSAPKGAYGSRLTKSTPHRRSR